MSGRGGKAKGRGGKQGVQQRKETDRVCKPTYKENKFPACLHPQIQDHGVPQAVQEALTDFSGMQPYFTALEKLKPEVMSLKGMRACWFGVPESQIESLERDETNRFFANLHLKNGKHEPVFIKRIHIMDPIMTLQGGCVWPREGALPAPSELWLNTLEKINDPLNEAYVDAVFAGVADRLVTHGLSPHWLRCYGSFPARVERYMYNISDEYPSLRRKTFFQENQAAGIFKHSQQADSDSECGSDSGPAVLFSEAQELDVGDFAALSESDADSDSTSVPNADSDTASDFSETENIPVEAEEVKLKAPKLRLKKLTQSDSSSSDSYSSHESDYNEHFAEFEDFPVQVTLLERAEGTLDELLEAEGSVTQDREQVWKAWVFQVIAALCAAQHWFGFVHNDLHTNNIMWSKTDKEYLYYRIHKGGANWVLRVPTYGYIMKIIDFGRASYHLPDPAGFFISDAFFPGNDAADQYNCDPFFDTDAGKKVEPNPSFDLCRLSVSMIESLFPTRPANATPIKIVNRDGNKTYAETTSPLYNLLWEWLIDDTGKSVLRTPEGEERYPDFDLYSAIAADVHKAVPALQVDKPLFAEYKYTEKTEGVVYDLWIR